MTLLVILIGLLSERYCPHTITYQRQRWFLAYIGWIQAWAVSAKASANLAIILLPLIIVTSIIYGLLGGWFWGFIGFLMNLFVFILCLGPDNPFYPITNPESPEPAAEAYFIQANRSLFAVIFWYALLGPIGLLIYRLLTMIIHNPQCAEPATFLVNALDWVTSRVTVLFYLLAGNFQQGFKWVHAHLLDTPNNNDLLLSRAGMLAATGQTEDEMVSLPLAQYLVERALIINVVAVALLTLGAGL